MHTRRPSSTDRRDFLVKAGLGVAAASTLLSDSLSAQASVARQLTESEKMSRLAMTCWPQRHLFKSYGRGTPNEETVGLRKKYGEITMHDLPKWTKDFFPGIYHLDLWSDVFGDPADTAQYTETTIERNGKPFTMRRWDPSAPADASVWPASWRRSRSRRPSARRGPSSLRAAHLPILTPPSPSVQPLPPMRTRWRQAGSNSRPAWNARRQAHWRTGSPCRSSSRLVLAHTFSWTSSLAGNGTRRAAAPSRE
jgi:hypothetical protein